MDIRRVRWQESTHRRDQGRWDGRPHPGDAEANQEGQFPSPEPQEHHPIIHGGHA